MRFKCSFRKGGNGFVFPVDNQQEPKMKPIQVNEELPVSLINFGLWLTH